MQGRSLGIALPADLPNGDYLLEVRVQQGVAPPVTVAREVRVERPRRR